MFSQKKKKKRESGVFLGWNGYETRTRRTKVLILYYLKTRNSVLETLSNNTVRIVGSCFYFRFYNMYSFFLSLSERTIPLVPPLLILDISTSPTDLPVPLLLFSFSLKLPFLSLQIVSKNLILNDTPHTLQ